jgi:hypothetical protein
VAERSEGQAQRWLLLAVRLGSGNSGYSGVDGPLNLLVTACWHVAMQEGGWEHQPIRIGIGGIGSEGNAEAHSNFHHLVSPQRAEGQLVNILADFVALQT